MLIFGLQRLTTPRVRVLANFKGFSNTCITLRIHKEYSVVCNRHIVNELKSHVPQSPTRLSRKIATSFISHNVKGIQENISALHMKKRLLRKKRSVTDDEETSVPGFWKVKSLATAEGYDLEGLMESLIKQNLYIPQKLCTSAKPIPDVIYAVAKYEVDAEPREIYLFREGTAVLWNISELECGNLLQFLKDFEEDSYSEKLVQSESELMSYTYTEMGRKSHLKDGDIMLSPHATELDKYTFSNAIALSVKLGIWEASLEHYIDSIAFVTDDLKMGRRIEMSREEVLRKQGELFALRHLINLSSDLLDTPDFYWERDELEKLFERTCSYFSIAKRTRVMNEKISHCVELVELLSSHLSDRHHVRLEWMIIALITVEVGFEILHYIERYCGNPELSEDAKETTVSE